MTFALTVASTPAALTLKPGGSGSVAVTIVNVSDIIEHYDVAIVGLPSEYVTGTETAGLKLKPRQSATVRLTVTVPLKGGIPSGRRVLGVLVSSRYTEGVRRSSELTLDVVSVSDLTLTPQPLIAQGRTGASFTVAVRGHGNTDVTVTLAAKDDQGNAVFTILPPSIAVGPGQATSRTFDVDVRLRGVLSGQERRTSIVFSAVVDGESRADAPVTLVQPPLIAAGVIRALGAVAAVLLIVGAIVAGYALKNTDAGLGANGSPTVAGATGKATSKKGKTPPPPATSGPVVPPATEEPDPSPPTDTSSEASPSPSPSTAPTADGAFLVPAADAATGVATCPEGTVVLGGGVDVATDDGLTPSTALMTSAPEDGDRPRSWRVSLLNQGTGEAAATVRATCASEPDGYGVITADLSVNGIGKARADCPAGQVILGGGVWTNEATPGPDTTMMESRPVDVDGRWSAWIVRVRSTSTETRNGTAYAICANELAAYTVVPSTPDVSDGETPGPESTEATASSMCPEGMRALSGGAGDADPSADQNQDPQTTMVQSTLVGQTTDDPGSGWVSVLRGAGATTASLTMYAVCGNVDPP